jgi:hypothetical protein
MIQKYIVQKHNQPVTLYRVRVSQRSRRNPALRVNKQEGGIVTEAMAIKRETQLKRECDREIAEMDGKGAIFSELVSECLSIMKINFRP